MAGFKISQGHFVRWTTLNLYIEDVCQNKFKAFLLSPAWKLKKGSKKNGLLKMLGSRCAHHYWWTSLHRWNSCIIWKRWTLDEIISPSRRKWSRNDAQKFSTRFWKVIETKKLPGFFKIPIDMYDNRFRIELNTFKYEAICFQGVPICPTQEFARLYGPRR